MFPNTFENLQSQKYVDTILEECLALSYVQ